jgi:hypothetical protein
MASSRVQHVALYGIPTKGMVHSTNVGAGYLLYMSTTKDIDRVLGHNTVLERV